METWMMVIGEPLMRTGKTRVFGSGKNPVNFVSTADVVNAVEAAVFDSSLRQTVVEVGGPEDLTWTEFTRIVQEGTKRPGKVTRVPLPMLRAMSILMGPVNPTMARQVRAAVVMDTRDMTMKGMADPSAVQRMGRLRLADVVRRDYVEMRTADPVVGKR
jgi:nucleoside-diphosphate-sugar epimerase